MNREKLIWYSNRLRTMPRAEVWHRLQEAYRMRNPLPAVALKTTPRLLHQENLPSLLDTWRFLWSPDVANSCEESAAAALSGSVEVFGRRWSTADLDWDLDPASNYRWPRDPAHTIDYRHSAGADPKWVWEVNRLLFLVPVAFGMQAGIVDRERGHRFLTSVLDNWITHCQVGRGPQWAASIEVAIRSIVITLAIQALDGTDEALVSKAGIAIRNHCEWIKRFPSLHSSANNHRVAEISALLIMDASWSDILDANEKVSLERELREISAALFSKDGLGSEQSPTYAGFSLEFLALALRTRRWSSELDRLSIAHSVSTAAAATAQLVDELGFLIRYGDDDEGRVVTVVADPSNYASALIALATDAPVKRRAGLLTFASGGLSLFRFTDFGAETTWLFDHGPLGFGAIAAHGHADALSVSMRSDGAEWIVDAGTYRYHGDRKWRTYFRSSRAHNGPQLEDLDSSVMTGDFNWHPVMRAECNLIASRSDGCYAFVHASQDGFRRQGLAEVSRKLERLSEGRYRVTDVCEGEHRMSSGFLINPMCKVTQEDHLWVVTHPDSVLTLLISVSGQDQLTLETPEDNAAWYSQSFGSKTPAWRLVATVDAELDVRQPQLVFDFELRVSRIREGQ